MIAELETKRRAAQRKLDQAQAPLRQAELAARELADLDQQIEAERAATARQATITRLLGLASTGAQALADVQQAQQAFDEAIAPLLVAYSEAKQRQAETRRAFYATLREISPAAGNLRADQTTSLAILDDLESTGVDLAGVLSNIGGMSMPLDRPFVSGHQFMGALAAAQREKFVHDGGHLPPPQ